MKKTILNVRNFNALKRDPNGSKTQRIWFSNFMGMGVDLGKTKKTFIFKYKSLATGKYTTTTLESYSYEQIIDKRVILDLEEDYISTRK